MTAVPPELLRNPMVALQAFGQVLDQKTSRPVPFDVNGLTQNLQATVLSYISNTPRNEYGQTMWLNLLGGRQAGKSLIAEIGGYPMAAYNQGWDHLCIADTKERSDYLHNRVQFMHKRWPENIRVKTLGNRESRQITFQHGGRMRVLSGQAGAVGIGQSPDFFHGSELAFWLDAAKQWEFLAPSMLNRDNSLMVMECTPCTMDAPSAQWWHDRCRDARMGRGRNLFAFFPFWDTRLCHRPWPKDSAMTTEELRLWERYADQGLTKTALAFRREAMENVDEIRANPDLFAVYYPFDPISCWLSTSRSVIRPHILKRHFHDDLVKWDGPYMEYSPPRPGAVYVIGADPAGWGMDHSAFHVLELWQDGWEQVAVFQGNVDPARFAKKLLAVGHRYNNARIGVERNGVGAAALAMLEAAGYHNLQYDRKFKPGVWKSSHDQMLEPMIRALLDELNLKDEDTLSQLQTYNNDKLIEPSTKSLTLNQGKMPTGRRERHHWDKVSALAIACIVAYDTPAARRSDEGVQVIDREDPLAMTYNELERFRKLNTAPEKSRGGRTPRYRSFRRKR